MKVTCITVGKIKEKFFRQAIEEYMKRLQKYCKPEIIEVADERTPDKAGGKIEAQIKDIEGGRILKHIRSGDFVIALTLEGSQLSSESLAAKIETLGVRGIHHIVFVIGGSLGLSAQVAERADFKLSFSSMTFPHQLMRVLLLEQIYRSFCIINHTPYHK